MANIVYSVHTDAYTWVPMLFALCSLPLVRLFVYSFAGFEYFAIRTFRANNSLQREMNCEKCQNESVEDL